jgi:hypothetical protein
MILYNHQKLKIILVEKNGIKYLAEVWSGFINSNLFRELLQKSIEIYKSNIDKIKEPDGKVLLYADTSKIEVITKEDLSWCAENINPLYEEMGFTHQAVIMPERFFGQQSIKSYEEISKSGKMLTNVFKNEKEALDWFCNDKKLELAR